MVVYGEPLAESKVVASAGSRGDSDDNAMTEALKSVFAAGLIGHRRSRTLTDVIVVASTWMGWCNSRRLHSALGHRPPTEAHREWRMLQVAAA